MKIQYFSESGIEVLQQQLLIYNQDNNIKGILLLACDENNYNLGKTDTVLKKITKPVFGGIFPGIIFNNKQYKKGFIIVGFDTIPIVNTIDNISSSKIAFDDQVLKLADSYLETKTIFMFIDGFAERINAFIESIFSNLGYKYNYIGGGAGSLSLKQKPCIITNKGINQDCVVVAGINMDSGIGVKHGWETISGPYKITSAEKTIIQELDFKPAFDVYKEVVDKHSGNSINRKNFFEIAKAYPFGINKVDAEKVVRDPLFVGENNSLICVGEVNTGSFVDILTGNKTTLIDAAEQALIDALNNKEGEPEKFIFFIDCISRVLFLENDFIKELEIVHSKNKLLPHIGALTIGEIANNGKEYLEFYNKTSVIGCF